VADFLFTIGVYVVTLGWAFCLVMAIRQWRKNRRQLKKEN